MDLLTCPMAPKFNPRVPKRGVLRSIQKRPASKKNLAWRQTDYVRDPEAVPTIWNDRNKWKRSVADILQSTPSTLVPMLRADGLLPDWEGGQCPRCHRGNLKRQPLKSVVACQSTDAALTSAKPTSIHTMLIPSSSKAHSFGNPGCSAPASSQSCFACCCSSPSTSQSQSH